MIVRYDLQSNPNNIHPEQQFKKDGLKIIRSEASSYGGCWFLEIEEKKDLPEWYTVLKDFKFTDSDKDFASDL